MDWIFRNAIDARREESIYVDYVVGDGQAGWTSPAQRDELSLWQPSRVTHLAVALGRAGVTSEAGLRIVAAEWRGVVLTDATHWQEVVTRTRRVLTAIHEAGVPMDAEPDDFREIIASWGFPLHGLDLTADPVDVDELRDVQKQTWERLEREFYGYDDAYY